MAPGEHIPQPEAGDIPASALHADWSEDWAPTIRSPRNRKAILENRRLAQRPAADLALRLVMPEIGPVSAQDEHAFAVCRADPKRFTQLVGLASEAPRLAGIIDATTLRDLAQMFPLEDIRLAIACRAVVPASEDSELDLDNLEVAVRDAGPKILLSWADQVSPGLRGRVRLMLPKAVFASEATLGQRGINHVHGKIVRRVAELLSPP